MKEKIITGGLAFVAGLHNGTGSEHVSSYTDAVQLTAALYFTLPPTFLALGRRYQRAVLNNVDSMLDKDMARVSNKGTCVFSQMPIEEKQQYLEERDNLEKVLQKEPNYLAISMSNGIPATIFLATCYVAGSVVGRTIHK